MAQVGQGGATGDIFECINDGGGPSQGIGILGGSPQIECPRAVLQLNQLLADCAGGSVAGPELSCATMRGSFGDLAAMLNVSCLSTGVKVQQLNQMLLAFGQDLTQGAVAPCVHETPHAPPPHAHLAHASYNCMQFPVTPTCSICIRPSTHSGPRERPAAGALHSQTATLNRLNRIN